MSSNSQHEEVKHTLQDLKQLQALPLSIKISMTKYRIRQFVNEYGESGVYISFSGGKDSTVLLHIARELYPNIKAVYVDTGLEYPEIRDFVKTKDNVEWLKPKINFKEVILKYGYPIISKEQSQYIYEYRNTKSEKLKDIRYNGNKYNRGKISKKWRFLIDAPFKISHKCCQVMKKSPMKTYENKYHRYPIVGTMAEESSNRVTSWLRNGCNSFNIKRPMSRPLSFWTDQDILTYIVDNHLDYAACYGDIIKNPDNEYNTTKCKRTGCVFCMYGCQLEKESRFIRLKETHPNLYKWCMKPIEDGGLGLDKVLSYINIKH